MFKNLFFALVFFYGLVTFAQTTPIPDANFEQFLVDQGIDTNGLNGNILDADAQAVTALNVTRNDITDFTGLEAFVNLTVLDLGLNDFATAPLTTLVLLEELVFDDNDILASLDITQNVNLKILNIGATGNGGTPPIPILDISQNTALETIYIYAFTSLADIILPQTATTTTIQIIATAEDVFDFTNHGGLEELWLNQNTQTTNITLPSVKTSLKKLDIRNQGVSSVDLTGFNVLEDVNLGGTNVSTLLLPTSTALKKLTISGHELPNGFSFASVPELEILHVTNNSLATPFDVDITSNTLIYDLNLSNNKMVNLDMTQNTVLTVVNVSNNNLVTFDSSQNVLLENLNASQNVITNLDLSQNVALETLNLNTNELPTLDLATNIELITLNLGTNELPNLNITTNTKIRTLYIDNNLFTGTGLDLTQNVDLAYLNAEVNQIESLDITQNLKLYTIILNHNLFPGTAILDQFYNIRQGDGGIRGGTLEVSHNLLTGQIPNFADLFHLGPDDLDLWTRYFELTIDNNYFHFADLEEDHLSFISYVNFLGAYNIPVIRKYHYAPQAKVNNIENPSPNAGEDITLTTIVRGSQNHYQWFKDGIPIPDTDSPEYTITDLNTCDAGVYHSEITSDLVPFENGDPPGTNGKNLLLVRNDITLTVNATKDCVTLDMPLTNVPINSGVQWNDNPGACGYKISLGTNSGATNLLPLTDVGEVTVYNHTTDFPSGQDIFVTIIPYYDDGDFSCSEQSFRTSSNSVAPQCTTLSNPLENATNVPASISRLEWNPANGADRYRLTISSPSGENDISGHITTDTFYDLTNDFTDGEIVTVTIVPNNDIGDAVGCAPESFTIAVSGGGPSAPNCTTLSSPVNNAIDISVDVAGIAWNAVADATGYRLAISSTSGNNDMPLTDMGDVLTHTFLGLFENDDVVNVTIIPYNAEGDAVGPCSPQSFTIEAVAPQPPLCTTLDSPSNNATDVAVDIGNITWSAAADATGYRLAITTTSGNNDLALTDVGNTLSHTFSGPFQNDDIVTVNIIPYNAVGDAVGPCAPESFTIEGAAPQPPLCTTLDSPANNATDVAVDISEIRWNPSAGATGYKLGLSSNSGNNELTFGDVGNVLSHSLSEPFLNGDVVTVTIVPYNVTGDAIAPCATQQFSILSNTPQPPFCTTLESPAVNDTNVATDISEITWNAAVGATGYRLEITSTSGNNNLAITDVGNVLSYSLSEPFENDDVVTVTIVPYNIQGDAIGPCNSESFTIMGTPTLPECASLSSPLNETTDVETDVAISWNEVENADGYRLSVGTSAGGTDLLNNEDVGILTTYDLVDDFPEGETIYVNIVPYNAQGEASDCTEQSFTISEIVSEDDTKYGFSPDGDGINEFWEIDGIENHPDNTVLIYNRWGDIVFQIEGYDNASNVFRGEANHLTKLGAGQLPAGTYFFRILLPEETTSIKKLTGYLVLKR